jgi:hypothetical protein
VWNLYSILLILRGVGLLHIGKYNIWHSEDRASWCILIIKANEMHCFSNVLHISDRFTVRHQESSTVYTAIGICHTGYAYCLLARSGWNILISLAESA